MNEQTDPWSAFLGWLTQIVTPDWASLIALLPLALLALVGLFLVATAYAWFRAGRRDRSRVRRPLPAGPPPAGVHLPGPSLWPFVVPVGALLILFALVIRPTDAAGNPALVNVPVLGVGFLVLGVGVAGWLLDAMREWRRTDRGSDAHGTEATLVTAAASGTEPHGMLAAATASAAATGGTRLTPVGGGGVRPWEVEPPPGVHLPGPSPWPLFAPVGMMFLLFGLVFSPAVLLGGLVMTLIAVAGWFRDAGSEYRQTEAGHAPEPATRDPERAFPKRLAGVFGAVAVVSVLLAITPNLLAFAQSTGAPAASASPVSGGGGGGAPADGPIAIVAESIAFNVKEFTAPAGKPFKIEFENKDSVQHNVAIYPSSDLSQEPLFMGALFAGPQKMTYDVPAIAAGSYYFLCSVHPNMNGTANVK